jgi:hypothetical protein
MLDGMRLSTTSTSKSVDDTTNWSRVKMRHRKAESAGNHTLMQITGSLKATKGYRDSSNQQKDLEVSK